jgi:hypothetical protein
MQHRTAPAGFRVRARHRPPEGNVLQHSAFLAEHVAAVGAGGCFEFRDLCAGTWELQPEFPATPSVAGASTPASPFQAMWLLLEEGQEQHLVLEASRLRLTVPQFAGVVRRNGAPMAGVLVRVREVPPDQGEHRTESRRQTRRKRVRVEPASGAAESPWLQQCQTDWFGDFEFAVLGRGTDYEVRFDALLDGRLCFLERRTVRTPDSGNAPSERVDLDVATGTVRLSCLENGRAFGGRMVRLRQVLDDGRNGLSLELLTDSNGECLSDDVPAGRWIAEPAHGGSFRGSALNVRGGSVVAATLEFTR